MLNLAGEGGWCGGPCPACPADADFLNLAVSNLTSPMVLLFCLDAVNHAGQMVCVVCITDEQKVASILDAVHSLLARQIGLVSVCDVEVIRQDHF